MLMINGYTFSEYSPMFWYCTRKKSRNCQAKARTDGVGNLRFLQENHTHEPPEYHVTASGHYVKISGARDFAGEAL
ncbi:hypothetical protein KGM_208250 [Danaus plexippus plexippus]|uniref:FLYWCH-type domain-containing protein n=2 Tax=Danaus plexippus TaxID=13037 RepID=A0A212FGW6_DANPL|nr:hypothetical protein KGM_208250 [Danaus plexippus plexippus]